MQEIIHCPGCQKKLQIPETLLGQDVQCPTCGGIFRAELDQQPAPPPRRPEDSRAEREEPADRPRSRSRRRRFDEDDINDRDDVSRGRRSRRRDFEPHRGGLILVLGILSIVIPIAGLVMGPIAWILGNQDMTAIQDGRMDPEGEGTTNAGRICGIIGTILDVVRCFGCCFYFLFVMAIVGASKQRF
jgi:hypothetical protein